MTLPGWASHAYVALALAVLGLLGARFAFGAELPAAPGARVTLQARQAVILGAVLLVALSPHYPWYFGWLAPLACLAPLPSVLWMLAAAPLLAHGAFEYLAIPGAVYGPAAVLAAFDLRRAGTRRADDTTGRTERTMTRSAQGSAPLLRGRGRRARRRRPRRRSACIWR